MMRFLRVDHHGCRWLAAVALCAGCGGSSPSEPSFPAVAGTYRLTLTRCSPATGAMTSMQFLCSQQNKWTVTQAGNEISATNVGQCPPSNWTGGFSARFIGQRRVEITALNYRQSSSHTSIETVVLSGIAGLDATGFSGTLEGEHTSTPVFGGFAGPTVSCRAQMPVQFIRQP